MRVVRTQQLTHTVLDSLHASSPGARNVGCPCIIHSTFAGRLQSEVKCGSCDNVTTAYDDMLDLSLDIGVEGETSLTACLDRFTASESLAAKQYTCDRCGEAEESASKRMSVNTLPPVLCIQLKRFEHAEVSRKIDTRVSFPLRLDMSPYTASARGDLLNSPSADYDLISVVCHEGQINSGHYTNFAKHGDRWLFLNDENIIPTTLPYVVNAQACACEVRS